jgi:hypothetical protein
MKEEPKEDIGVFTHLDANLLLHLLIASERLL